jgi:nucleoside-diphosphate-sugar epimerase
MRLDVSVNMLTMQALTNQRITVFGGKQVRPNVHMDDITDLYIFMLENPQQTSGIFNAGFENMSILDIAELVQEKIDCEIIVTPSNDPRSYRVNSDKLLATGFQPSKGVKDAISEITDAFMQHNLSDEPRFHNLKWMQQHVLK